RDLPDCSLNVLRERHWVVALRARHKVSLLGVTLVTGIVEIVTRIIDEAVVLYVTDNADDFSAAGAIVVAVNAFTQRIFVGPHALRQLMIDDGHIATTIRSKCVAVIKDAAAK